jgi:cathepsin X
MLCATLAAAVVASPTPVPDVAGQALQPTEGTQHRGGHATDRQVRRRHTMKYAGEVKPSMELWAQLAHHPMSSGFDGDRKVAMNLYVQESAVGANYTLKALPESFTWADVQGRSYLTPIRNQHIPTYCGSCWAFAATSTIADRWNVALKGKKGVPQPDLLLSTQNVLSCGNEAVQCGTCGGGDQAGVYKYGEEHGIPHESCSNYMAQDTTCSAELPPFGQNRPPCYNCDEKAKCYAIAEYHKLFVKQGSTMLMTSETPGDTIDPMKREILAHGPISCGIMATKKMEHGYKGGIFSEETNDSDARINHVVSVVGWGVDPDTKDKYWHVRNSWGGEWGDLGFAKIVTSDNAGPAGNGNNFLEHECVFAKPDRYAYS